jgi:serine/threonine-protein kinase
MNELASSAPESFGRYLLYPAIARGGMATVHTARLVGAEGFSRLVAAKRLHPQFTDDPDFITMFHDEACIASRIHHPNVVPVLDVVVSGNELILVQEYVHGVPLSQLMKVAQVADTPIPIDIAIAVLTGVLAGLHGAHEVRDEGGRPLEIVHRDVSPANVMVSIDGVPRLLDFGIAKARTSTHHTREGVFKGKLAYMAPEQLRMEHVDRLADVYATGVLAWEMLVNRRVYDNRHELAFVTAVMNGELPSLTAALADRRSSIDDARWRDLVALERIVSRAMSPRSEDRFANAADMARALLEVRPSATSMAVAEWVRVAGADFLDKRQKTLAANEESWRRTSLFTPSSGTQRVTPGPVVMSTPPPNVLSIPAPRESGAYRLDAEAPPFATLASRVRSSRYLPWVAAAGLVVATLVGSLLRGGADAPGDTVTLPVLPVGAAPLPAAAAAAAAGSGAAGIAVVPAVNTTGASPAAATTAGGAPSGASGASGASGTSAPATASPPPSPPPASTPTTQTVQAPMWRAFHAPPPRFVPPPRPAPPPPAPASTSSKDNAKGDCNPPFYFEGSKKVFKQSCL